MWASGRRGGWEEWRRGRSGGRRALRAREGYWCRAPWLRWVRAPAQIVCWSARDWEDGGWWLVGLVVNYSVVDLRIRVEVMVMVVFKG